MEPNWLDIVDDGDEDEDAPNPTRREGTFRVFEFSRDASHLPGLLEEIAAWARECAEYQVVDLAVSNADGWATVAVTVWRSAPATSSSRSPHKATPTWPHRSPTSSPNMACVRACGWQGWRRADISRIRASAAGH